MSVALCTRQTARPGHNVVNHPVALAPSSRRYLAPVVGAVAPPAVGTVPTLMTISGENFGSDGVVTIGGATCFTRSWSDSSVTCMSQATSEPESPVVVTVAGQSSAPSSTAVYVPPLRLCASLGLCWSHSVHAGIGRGCIYAGTACKGLG